MPRVFRARGSRATPVATAWGTPLPTLGTRLVPIACQSCLRWSSPDIPDIVVAATGGEHVM